MPWYGKSWVCQNEPGAYMTSQSESGGFAGLVGPTVFVALWVKMLKYENSAP